MFCNSSRLPDMWRSFLFLSSAGKSTSVYYQVTLTTCVITSVLAPMAVMGNALIMAAIWRNPSLRTPSYVLLAGLAFTDFCTGLLTQPFHVMYELTGITGNIKMFCIALVFTDGVNSYLTCLTGFVMTIIAVERWLHMSRRSLLTVRRVIILYITFGVCLIPFDACYMYSRYTENTSLLRAAIVIFLLSAALCFLLSIFAYFKVFRIIRQHQTQVQTNQNAINMKKYRKSIFTILYILAISVISYLPYVCCVLIFSVIVGPDDRTESVLAAANVCATLLLSSSFFNPLLYYWRIKEIRDNVRNIVRKLCCKENVEESC